MQFQGRHHAHHQPVTNRMRIVDYHSRLTVQASTCVAVGRGTLVKGLLTLPEPIATHGQIVYDTWTQRLWR